MSKHKCSRRGKTQEKPNSDKLPWGWIRLTRQHKNRGGNTSSLVCSVRCGLFELRSWHQSDEEWHKATKYGPTIAKA